MLTYGGAILYTNAGNRKVKYGNGRVEQAESEINSLGAQFYLPIHFNPTITLIPVVGWTQANFSAQSDISTAGQIAIGASGRFTF